MDVWYPSAPAVHATQHSSTHGFSRVMHDAVYSMPGRWSEMRSSPSTSLMPSAQGLVHFQPLSWRGPRMRGAPTHQPTHSGALADSFPDTPTFRVWG
jgi:hypothetical protein